MGDGKGGGGSVGSVQIPNIADNMYTPYLSQMAQTYYKQTEPLRQVFYKNFMDLISGTGTYNPVTGSIYDVITPQGQWKTGTQTTAANVPAAAIPTQAVAQPLPSTSAFETAIKNAYYGGTPGMMLPMGEQFDPSSGQQFLQQYNLPTTMKLSDLPSYLPDPYQGPGFDMNPEAQKWIKAKAQEYQQEIMSRNMQQMQAAPQAAPQAQTVEATSQRKFNPYDLPMYQPIYNLSRVGLEDQYGQAKEQILSTLRGGAREKALSDLEKNRAYQVGALPAQISTQLMQDIINKAYGIATGAPQVAMSGQGAAAGILSAENIARANIINSAQQFNMGSLNAAAMQPQNQSGAGYGAGLGALMGGLIFK